MSDKPFRILLDLTDLHVDELKYVWLNISPRELKTIYDLKNCMFKRFNFPKANIKLLLHDGLLLDEELIIILREDDTIRVQYEEKSSEMTSGSVSPFSKSGSQKRKHRDYSDSEPSPSEKRVKKNSITFNDVDVEIPECNNEVIAVKKKKKHKKSSQPITEEVNSIQNEWQVTDSSNSVTDYSLNETKHHKKKHSKSYDLSLLEKILNSSSKSENLDESKTFVKSSEKSLSEAPSELNNHSPDIQSKGSTAKDKEVSNETTPVNICHKKKRKRHKKRKVPLSISGSFTSNSHPEDTIHFPQEQSAISMNSAAVRKHIVFASPNPYQESLTENPQSDPSLNYSKSATKSIDFSIMNTTGFEANTTAEFPSSCNISTPVSSESSNGRKTELFISDKSNTEMSVTKTYSQVDAEHTKRALNDDGKGKVTYEDFPLLNTIPEIGYHIAFKIIELSENYSPEVSEYKEGIVKSINPETQEIEIQLVQEEILPGRVGKFENLEEDEVPEAQTVKKYIESWSSLIQPRLISS